MDEVSIERATRWAKDVVTGDEIACKWVKLAAERHLHDVKRSKKSGYPYHFNVDSGQFALDFFSLLHHSKGEWAGTPIVLAPWQQFIIGCVFGWLRNEDQKRRFRTIWEEIARKNGKTTKLSGVGLLGLTVDGEGGAEIYSAATKRDQAKICFDEAVSMRDKSPSLRKMIGKTGEKNVTNLHVLSTASKFEPLGRDADTMDGLNVHIAIVDEMHAHKTREMWDILDSATGSRSQSLIWGITTAGFNKMSVGYELHNYAKKVLQGSVDDPTFFAIIFTVDELEDILTEQEIEKVGDDRDSYYLNNQEEWKKANPNLGVSVKLDDMERKAIAAREMPSARNNFLCKHLNIWTNQETLWMNMLKWAQCLGEVDLEFLREYPCYGGLDLSSKLDVTAFVKCWVVENKILVSADFWLPEDRVKLRVEKQKIPYDVWAKAGYIKTTPGNVIDYDFIEESIQSDLSIYNIQEIGFDDWNATQVSTNLSNDGFDMIPMRQGFKTLSPPMKELEIYILNRKIVQDGNPVLAWMMENVSAIHDPTDNIKPDKKTSQEKIDGAVALIMAIGRLMLNDPGGGYTTEHGVVSLN